MIYLFISWKKIRDSSRRRGDGREMLPSRSRLGLTGLGSTQDLGSSNGDLYYNSRPEGHWSYQPPPPPVITHQPKPSATQHFQPYERGYPKTLESLAEKVSQFHMDISNYHCSLLWNHDNPRQVLKTRKEF